MADLNSRAFIFDMDGTLVDNMQFHTKAWRQMLSENGVEMDPEEFLIRTAGKTNAEILPAIFANISGERLQQLGDRKEALYRGLFLAHRKPVAGVVDFLERTRQLGIKMAVATAAPNANVEFILDGLDMRHFFQAITTAADIANGKPDPEIFLRSAEKLNVEPADCLVFEDAFNGFEAAHRAGMRSVGIATVNPVEEILKRDSVVEAHKDFLDLRPETLIEKYIPKKYIVEE
jgi:beta-phosphoglucomutase family hydrolase